MWQQEVVPGFGPQTFTVVTLEGDYALAYRCGDYGVLGISYTAQVRDWSLITGTSGIQNGRGGHVKFYPYEKGGQKKF